ncbi:MAG: hypothetical protein ACRD6X_00040 [Pyrinomonadaceae bacterium]
MNIKIYIGITAALILIIASYSVVSYFQLRRLEADVEKAKQTADVKQKQADELEKQARKYEEKIAFLETNLETLKTLAKKQDEELSKLENTTDNARADVERRRRIRSAAATAEELCAKLADLGHPCQ